MRRLLRASVLLVSLFVACDSPFEPKGDGERIPLNLVIEQDVTNDSARFYSFAAGPKALYAVYFQVLRGNILLGIVDSVTGSLVASVSATPSSTSGRLEDNAVGGFFSQTAGVYRISLQTFLGGTSSRFRFKIVEVNTNPEHVPSFPIEIGDTVEGETIDPKVDLDRFVVRGDAGQEVIFVGETPAPAGSGSVSFTLVDTVTQQFLGYVFADAGPPTLTSGRMLLPGTRGYALYVASVTSNVYPRYAGPYRFWSYAINRDPEHRAAPLQFDTEIGNETIDRAGDIDEFTFVANRDNDFKAFVQAPWTVQLEVLGPNQQIVAAATSQAADTSLFNSSTIRFTSAASGTYTLRVSGSSPSFRSDTGGYRIFLHAVDRAPEHVPAAIAPGDTITTEDIGLPGDVDEFTFSGVAGAEYNAFIAPQNANPDSRLQLEVLDPAGTAVPGRRVEKFGSDTSLFTEPTGRFALPSTGVYRLRVSGVDGFGMPFYRGGYRVALHQIDRRPESAPRTFAFGDSVFGEAIDGPGDVDEFVVTVPDSSGANVALAIDSAAGTGGLMVQLLDSASGQLVGTAGAALSPARGGSGRMLLAPRKYLLRVWPSTYEYDRSTFRGPYRIWFYRFAYQPEVASDTFAIGDTVGGEVIEPWGDEDQFHFYGLAGQHVNIMAQGLAPPSGGVFEFFVVPPAGVPGYGLFLNAPTSGAALEDLQTRRVDLLGTGWYTVIVRGGGGGFDERGAYRFTVLPFDPGPEHVSATLSAGDSVTTEPIDQPGDWDEFTLTGTPGQRLSVLFDGDVYTGLELIVRDPASGDTLAWQPNQFRRIVGPFRIPAVGQVKVSVEQHGDFFRICYNPTCNVFSYAGPYRFFVLPVNPAPESVPAAFVVGDTVRGETIAPVGDIDEFTSTGTPGAELTLQVRLATAASSGDSAVVIEAIDPATGTSLAGSNAATWGATFWTVGTFIVPAGGAFIVRARAYGEWGYGFGVTSQYEFLVKQGP